MEKIDLRNPYRMKRKRPSVDQYNVVFDSSNDPTTISNPNGKINDNPTRKGVTSDKDNICRSSAITNHHDGPNATASASRSKFNMSDLVVSASDKAGMDGIDRAAIDAIIERESGNSLFMQQQKKRDEKVNQRIAAMKQKMQALLQHNTTVNNNTLHHTWRMNIQRQVDAEMLDCLSSRPIRSCKVVVDMDMFYMACELLTRPDITPTTPACVGGTSMITTSNYAARRYGVRAAMPGYIGSALVHQLSKGRDKLIFCPLNFDLYKEKSLQVRQVLSEYDPNLTAYSLDEAYMDLARYLCCSLIHQSWKHEEIKSYLNGTSHSTVPSEDDRDRNTDAAQPQSDVRISVGQTSKRTNMSLEDYYDQLQHFSTAECLSRTELILIEMRERVRSVTGGLTCSAGCAPNFLLAKIASDINKPNGQCIVSSDHESIVNFLHPLPIRKISGIGRVTEKILRAFDIVTVQQLYNERATIRLLFDRNPSTSNFLIRASFGCGSSDSISSDDVNDSTSASSQQKGISRERTIPSGKTWAEINSKLEDIACLLSDDMQKKDLAANTIYVKVKLHTFDLLSHGRTLPRGMYIHSANDLIQIATELLHEIRRNETESKKGRIDSSMIDDDNNNNIARQLFSVRLVGIRCTNFKSQSSNSDSVKIGGTQRTMDQFLVMSLPRNQANNNHTPPLELADDIPIGTAVSHRNNVHTTEYSNPYGTSTARSPQGCDQSGVAGNETGTGSVSDPIPIRNDATREGVHHHSPDNPTRKASEWICCPICHVRLRNHSNDVLNRHIDVCLNGSTVQKIVREVNEQQQQQQEHHQKCAKQNNRSRKLDFFKKKMN